MTTDKKDNEWPKRVEWLGVPRWECSNGVLYLLDSYNLAKEYQTTLDKKQDKTK